MSKRNQVETKKLAQESDENDANNAPMEITRRKNKFEEVLQIRQSLSRQESSTQPNGASSEASISNND